jgi:hypothetical protein
MTTGQKLVALDAGDGPRRLRSGADQHVVDLRRRRSFLARVIIVS